MKKILISLAAICFLLACNNKPTSNKQPVKKDPSDPAATVSGSGFNALIDSMRDFKPAVLSIPEERSDLDNIIPVGYNDHGSFAYFHEKDMGGAVDYEFHIQPTYDKFEVMLSLDMEEQGDSVLDYNKELIGQALRSAQVKLNNSIQRITVAELEKKYKIRFSSNKTWGPPNADYGSDKKTLSSVNISYKRGDDGYSTYIINENYPSSWGVWDCYVSDIILVPTKELGIFGFVVLVTESIGFEGYTRKEIKLVSLGDVDG